MQRPDADRSGFRRVEIRILLDASQRRVQFFAEVVPQSRAQLVVVIHRVVGFLRRFGVKIDGVTAEASAGSPSLVRREFL